MSSGENKKKKHRYSSFLVTVNTNVQMGKKNSHTYPFLAGSFSRAVRSGFGNRETMSNFIRYLAPGSWEQSIQMVDVYYALEKGSNKNAIHSHVLVKITHNSKIHLDPRSIQAYFRQSLGRNVYVNIRSVPDDQYVKDYILKGSMK